LPRVCCFSFAGLSAAIEKENILCGEKQIKAFDSMTNSYETKPAGGNK